MARKTLKVPEDLFIAMDKDKDDQQSWPHYLEERCLIEREQTADLNALDVVIEELEQSGLNYDDVKNACAAAIREELEGI